MKFKDVIVSEEKQRLDPHCWSNKKIGNPKTKVKGGVRVNNCVPKEGIEEAMRPVPVDDQGNRIPDRMSSNEPKRPFGQPGDSKSSPKGVVTYTPTGIVHRSNHGDVTPRPRAVPEGELRFDPLVAEIAAKMQGPTKDDAIAALITVLGTRAYAERPGFYSLWLRQAIDKYSKEGVAEGFNGEYDDEAGMAQGNLYTIAQAAQGLLDTIDHNDNLPEWAQEKIAKVEGMLVTVWNYLQSQKAQGIDPEINEMYEAMDQLAEEMAQKNGVSVDAVWESFEALPDNMLYETAAWRRKEGKSKKGGLNAKGVASYRRENPGSKLQTAVTTKPSKLKPGSKDAKRRKSFCARMSGVKGPAKKPNGEPTRKTLALRKWNC